MNKTNTRYTLQITISMLFLLLTLTLGVLISFQNYNKLSSVMLESADEVQDRITNELSLDFKASYAQVSGTLKLLALSPVTGAQTFEQRLLYLDIFTTALSNDPSIVALQIAYQNGDYFVVRSLHDEAVRERFSAPGSAAFMADHISTGTDGRLIRRLYFDRQLKEVAREPAKISTYDPRTRTWYRQARTEPAATSPYLFYFIARPGVTASIQTANPGVVIASDITLDNLNSTISKYRITPDSEVVLIDAEGQTFAYREPEKLITGAQGDELKLAHLNQLGSGVLGYLSKQIRPAEQNLDFEYDGRYWTGSTRIVTRPGGIDLFALMVSPVDELLSEAFAIRTQSLVTTAIILLLFIPLIWLTAKQIAASLKRLAAEAASMSRFEFDAPIETRSRIREVNELAVAMNLMKSTINRFITLVNSLAGEQDLDRLLQTITLETMHITQADAALTWLLDETDNTIKPGALCDRERNSIATDSLPILAMQGDHELVNAARNHESAAFDLTRTSENSLSPLLDLTGAESLHVITLPLADRNDETIGLLNLLYRRDTDQQVQAASMPFVQALSGFAAVTLQSRQMLKMQEALLNAFIKLIAGAIDAKSPYTGGHCQRVPEITRLLAQAACDTREPPFTEFSLDEKQWEALDIACWLHDCGKVTTPEYVVDKSTKLETIYDRIHEIRMRFEVLKRDAEIEYWRQLTDNVNRRQLLQQLEHEWQTLDEEFAFIAQCNEGGEFMAEDKIDRLRQIASRTWKRTLDDRIGISHEELLRKNRSAKPALPVEEQLLADRPDHIIERSDTERMPADNPWGFRVDTPAYKYNRGELYNLTVSRGTLSNEERYEINGHMIQTIIMLNKLPYPKHLQSVPLIAGCHHETMDGSGYPKRLTRDQMPITGRMMAIADIFEALTASDRPYKKAKTLSEAIRIMSFMRNDNHIDADLFALFLSSGVYRTYGERFLAPEQLDEVDVSVYLNT